MRYLIILALAVTLAGCDHRNSVAPSGTNGTLTSTGSSVNAESLSIAGVATVSRGSRIQLRSFVHFSNGTEEDVTSKTVWGSSDSGVASVEPEGWVTGVDSGAANISARFEKVVSQLGVSVSGTTAATAPGGSNPVPPGGPSAGSGPTPPSSPPGSTPNPCVPSPLLPQLPPPIPCIVLPPT